MTHEESRIQQGCVRWFRYQFPNLARLLFAVPNGGRRDAVTGKILELTKEALAEGHVTAVLTTGENGSAYDALMEIPGFHRIELGDTDDGQTVASHLYGALRTCDDLKCDVIYSENFRRDELGSAIMNRLIKAAGHRVISV